MRPIPCSSLRIAINIANRSAVSEGQQSYLNRVLALLRTRGAAVEEIRQMPSPYLRVIMQWEFKPHLEAYLRASHGLRSKRSGKSSPATNPIPKP